MGVISFVERTRPLDLYEKAKRMMWNPETDLDWTKATGPKDEFKKIKANLMSSLYYGELKGLEVAAKSLVLAEKEDEKLHFSMQTLEEARHIEALARYLAVLEQGYRANLKAIEAMDAILVCETYGELIAGNSIGSELWANEIYSAISEFVKPYDPWLSDFALKILGDESRHVAFGHTYFQERGTFTQAERAINQKVTDLMSTSLEDFARHLGLIQGFAFKPLLNRILGNIQLARKKTGVIAHVTEV